MTKFILEIACENAAFDEAMATEISTILRRQVIEQVEDGKVTGLLFDSDGNHVGFYNIRK